MASIRQKQRDKLTQDKKSKKVIKTVLSAPFTIKWPVLSSAAQQQVEHALKEALGPLVQARARKYGQGSDSALAGTDDAAGLKGEVGHSEPIASTSGTFAASGVAEGKLDISENAPSNDDQQPRVSKRRKRVLKKLARLEQIAADIPGGMHELTLRSGSKVQVPDHLVSRKQLPTLVLDKQRAMEERPDISTQLIIGINSVTKALEEDIEDARRELAGLLPLHRFGNPSQDSLRSFIHAPTRGTRKQRRELRKSQHPEAESRKQKARAVEKQLQMPDNLAGVPLNDPVLLHSLEELAEAPILQPQDKPPLAHLLAVLSSTKQEVTAPDESMDTANHPPKTVKLPSQALITLLSTRSSVPTSHRSILLSLLSRHDPGWVRGFMQWQFQEDQKHLVRDITSLIAGKRKRKKDDENLDAAQTQQESLLPGKPKPALRVVFVAKEDINPLDIVQHILTSVAAHNSLNVALRKRKAGRERGGQEEQKDYKDIMLVPLPKGAEARLASILNLRRVAVLGVTESQGDHASDALIRLIHALLPDPVKASWLVPAKGALDNSNTPTSLHIPAHVKQMQTEIPADLKAYKASKKEAKKEVKRSKTSEKVYKEVVKEELIDTQITR